MNLKRKWAIFLIAALVQLAWLLWDHERLIGLRGVWAYAGVVSMMAGFVGVGIYYLARDDRVLFEAPDLPFAEDPDEEDDDA